MKDGYRNTFGGGGMGGGITRRELIIGGVRVGGALAIGGTSVMLMGAQGCKDKQNTAAALIGIAGVAIASLETIEGRGDVAASLRSVFSAAQTAVLNWKAGTPTQDVSQALQIVQNDLLLLPVSVQTQAYIELAIGTVQAVLDLFPGTAPQFATTAKVRRVQIVAPKTAAEFRQTWNALPGHLAPLK